MSARHEWKLTGRRLAMLSWGVIPLTVNVVSGVLAPADGWGAAADGGRVFFALYFTVPPLLTAALAKRQHGYPTALLFGLGELVSQVALAYLILFLPLLWGRQIG